MTGRVPGREPQVVDTTFVRAGLPRPALLLAPPQVQEAGGVGPARGTVYSQSRGSVSFQVREKTRRSPS